MNIRSWQAARIVAIVVGLLLAVAPFGPARAVLAPDNGGPADVSVADPFQPDPIADGTPRRPSRDVGKVKREQRGLPAVGSAGQLAATDYAQDGYQPQTLPSAALPYVGQPLAPLVDGGLHDAAGVRMFRWDGVVYNHPVAQAQWGLTNLDSYRITQNRFYLDRAISQAQRNLDRKVESRGAWWYPYDFDLIRCSGRPVLQAPWYSAMAQGLLLSLFVRLYETTLDEKWRLAADNTFISLTLPAQAGAPWAAWVDSAGYLWLEEYPASPGSTGERVLNGHIFTLYGVYDYWRLTSDARAATIFGGAASTVRRYVPSNFRVLRWASRYSIGCPGSHLKYHQIHTSQALKLYEMTHAGTFADYAHLLRYDYPAPLVNGTVRFSGGTHVGYRFNASGAVIGQKLLTLSRASAAHADQRIRVYGRGIYYRITNGTLAGYLVSEVDPQRILLGKAVEHRYAPLRSLAFQPGTYTGYRYDSVGNVIGSKRITYYRSSSAPLGATAWVNGRFSYQVTAGAYLGYWLPHTSGLAMV